MHENRLQKDVIEEGPIYSIVFYLIVTWKNASNIKSDLANMLTVTVHTII